MNRFTCIVVLGALMVHCAFAERVHIVGDSLGWDVPPNGAAAYTNWASGKTFMVGDILVFNFTTNNHDVLQVTRASFDACTSDNAIGNVILTGPANITLSSPGGDHYYICTIGRHCLAGQKLAISVSGTPGAANPPPTPSPTSSQPGGMVPPPPPPPPNTSSSRPVLASVVLTLVSIAIGFFL